MEEIALQAILKEMGDEIQILKHNVQQQANELLQIRTFVMQELMPIVNESRAY